MAVESLDDTHLEYRWVHDAHHRSQRVPRAHWDSRKTELRDLYHEMSLDDLMDFMKEKPGFAPTRRQYTYQFEKWGFTKYRKETAHPSGAETLIPDAILKTAPSATDESPAILEGCEHGKRHRSMQSTQSSASGSSNSWRPPAKKGRHDPQYEPAIETSAYGKLNRESEIGIAVATPSHMSESIGYHPMQTDLIETSHPTSQDRPDRGDLNRHPSFFCDLDIEVPSNSLEQCKDEDQRLNFPSRWGSVEEISKTFRAITAQRPLSTYTAEDMDEIQLAAEYLEAMGYEEDAFSLYALLLKRLHEDCPQDEMAFLHAIINYSRCVSTPGHCEIIQHHLRGQAQQLSDEVSSCLLHQFLIEMAFAETYSRKYDITSVKVHLRKARQLIPGPLNNDFHQVIKQLPQNNRNLDLILYLGVRRVCDPYAENLLPLEDPKELHSWELTLSALERTTLYRVPGPFELTGSEMGYPCIRSCLKWCHQNLGQLKYVPGPWMEFLSLEKKVPRERTATVHRMFLFTCLWNIWPKDAEASSLNEESDAWMLQAPSRLGVNATELLMITCAQIVHESSSSEGLKTFRFEQELIYNLRRGTERLLENFDNALAQRFLNAFVQYRTLEEGEARWLKDLHQGSREGTVGQLERALQTTFSQTREFTTQLTRSSRRLSTQVAASARHMTMASCLRSSDSSMLNFRKVKESMGERVRKLKEQPSISSISFGESSMRSRWSIWTLSQLSQTMERTSLSLQST